MFKVLKENIVIDILEEPIWVGYSIENKMFIRSLKEYAQGLVSSDGSVVWALNDELINNIEGIEKVSIVEITEEEAAELRVILNGNGTDEITTKDSEGNEVTEQLSTEQIYPKVPFTELQATVSDLLSRLSVLEEKQGVN